VNNKNTISALENVLRQLLPPIAVIRIVVRVVIRAVVTIITTVVVWVWVIIGGVIGLRVIICFRIGLPL
jgi:hypothetical protein